MKNNIVEFRVRGTAGGDRLTVPYDVSASTANLEVVKILIHSTISTKRHWATIDIKDFYLGTPLPPGHYEYMRIHRSKLPHETILKHRPESLFHDDYIYFEVQKCLYGLPQSGKLYLKPALSNILPRTAITNSPMYPVSSSTQRAPLPFHSSSASIPQTTISESATSIPQTSST